jgi:hypothetical protein
VPSVEPSSTTMISIPGELAFDARSAGALAEHPPQQVADRGARRRRRFEDMRLVGPCESAAVSAAAVEEFFIAAAGERIIVEERLVGIMLQRGALYQHAAGAIDHRHRSRCITMRGVEPAFGEPMIRRIENRKDRTADNLNIVLQDNPDHFGEPVRVGEFVTLKLPA